MTFSALDAAAWTGNDPERLAAFYTDDDEVYFDRSDLLSAIARQR